MLPRADDARLQQGERRHATNRKMYLITEECYFRCIYFR